MHEAVTGLECPSCGLSHGFSLILRGRIDEALLWNHYTLRIFMFFALQLVLRVALSFMWVRLPGGAERDSLVVADTVVTILMFLIAFFPFLRYYAVMVRSLF